MAAMLLLALAVPAGADPADTTDPTDPAVPAPPVTVPAPGPADDAVVIAVVDSGFSPYHQDLDADLMPQQTDADPTNASLVVAAEPNSSTTEAASSSVLAKSLPPPRPPPPRMGEPS